MAPDSWNKMAMIHWHQPAQPAISDGTRGKLGWYTLAGRWGTLRVRRRNDGKITTRIQPREYGGRSGLKTLAKVGNTLNKPTTSKPFDERNDSTVRQKARQSHTNKTLVQPTVHEFPFRSDDQAARGMQITRQLSAHDTVVRCISLTAQRVDSDSKRSRQTKKHGSA